MRHSRYLIIGLFVAAIGSFTGWSTAIAQTADRETVERGKYLITIAGCNDCHTPGYLLSEGKTPEELWLTGDTFGWRGPWGTTYATNLRTLVQGLTENQWVVLAKNLFVDARVVVEALEKPHRVEIREVLAKNLKARPPMPWFNLNAMKDGDLRAVYQYIRHLGPGGEVAPAFLPPDQEPDPPYALFPPPPPQ